MKQVILYIACSLDGFIARPDGSIDWLKKYEGKGEDYGYHEFMKKVDCVVMGSKTYERCLEFEGWPENKKLKTIVVTKRNLRKVLGANISFHAGTLD
ncbi:MAG: dihydrofolate reductase family protein, partial [Candidatus Nanoarchaeia archaeon]